MGRNNNKQDEPQVTVIVLNWNGLTITYKDKPILESTLETLNKSIYGNLNVILTDADSQDNSINYVKKNFKHIDVLSVKNNGVSYAFNMSIKYVFSKYPKSKYLLFLNNDLKFVDPDWITKLVKIGEKDPSVGIIGCRLLDSNGVPSGSGSYIARFYSLSSKNKKSGYADSVNGAVFLVKSNMIKKIGLFDEIYLPFFAEEWDYCLRAKSNGYNSYYVNSVNIMHLEGYSIMKTDIKKKWSKHQLEYYSIRNNWIFILRWYPYLLPLNLFYNLVQSLIKKDNGLHFRKLNDVIFRLGSNITGFKDALSLYKQSKIPKLSKKYP